MEQYNKNRIKELMQETGAKRADLKRALGISNETTILRYVDGEDIHVSRLLQLAQFFGKSISDFFIREGSMSADGNSSVSSKMLSLERKLHELEMTHLKEVMQLRISYERQLAAAEREVELLREELNKRGSAPHPSIPYIEKVEKGVGYLSKVAEEENGL